MTATKSLLMRSVCLLLVVLAFSFGSLAQQESSSGGSQPTASPAPAEPENDYAADESSSVSTPVAPSSSDQSQVRQLGRATPLVESMSPLRWRYLSLSSVDLYELYGSFASHSASVNRTRSVTVFGTNFIFDRQLRRTRLALQYRPRLAVVDGQVGKDFQNQALALDTYWLLSPRWSVALRDSFTYVHSRLLVPEDFFQVDSQSGNTLQGNFIDSGRPWYMNEVSAQFGYRWSGRTQFLIEPRYGYGHSSNENSPVVGHYYGSTFTLAHLLGSTRSIGFLYGVRVVTGSAFTIPTTYQSVGIQYRQQLSRTWWVHGALMAVVVNPNLGQAPSKAGSLNLVKTSNRSTLSFAYTLDQGFSGYVTDRYADRADVGYKFRLTRDLAAGVGAGFYRETGPAPRNEGKYGQANVDYLLTRDLIFSVRYSFKDQHANTAQFLAGKSSILYFGISWVPKPVR